MRNGIWINTETPRQFLQGLADHLAGKPVKLTRKQEEKALSYMKSNQVTKLMSYLTEIAGDIKK